MICSVAVGHGKAEAAIVSYINRRISHEYYRIPRDLRIIKQFYPGIYDLFGVSALRKIYIDLRRFLLNYIGIYVLIFIKRFHFYRTCSFKCILSVAYCTENGIFSCFREYCTCEQTGFIRENYGITVARPYRHNITGKTVICYFRTDTYGHVNLSRRFRMDFCNRTFIDIVLFFSISGYCGYIIKLRSSSIR